MYYDEQTVFFLDGRFVRSGELADHGADALLGQTMQYGFGLFEGLRAYETVNGVKIFRGPEHFRRLLNGCADLGMPVPYSAEELCQISYRLLDMNDLGASYLRPLVFCPPQMTLSAPRQASVFIAAWKWARYFGEQSLQVGFSQVRRPDPQSHPCGLKATGNYLPSMMASMEARKRGYDEAIMLDTNGFVAQAPGANLFLERAGSLLTPPEGHVFPGITRRTILALCHELGIPVQERPIKPTELLDADAAFLCGTATEITPIASVEGMALSLPWEQSVSYTIQQSFQSQVTEKSGNLVIV